LKFFPLVTLFAYAAAASAADSPTTAKSETMPRYAFLPLVKNFYPAASLNLKEAGTTRILLCYDNQGTPIQVTMIESSGFRRLDEAALRWGNAVRIAPGLSRGQPRADCVRIPVKFHFEQTGDSSGRVTDSLRPDVLVPPILTDVPLPPPPPPGRFIPLGRGT
jgi:TonB family protein